MVPGFYRIGASSSSDYLSKKAPSNLYLTAKCVERGKGGEGREVAEKGDEIIMILNVTI